MVPHCILFELANFHGSHRHVFAAEPNLAASDDPFNNKTSSIVVLEGEWEFFADVDFQNKIGTTLKPGAYPFVANFGMKNNSISSLRPVRKQP